MVKHSLPVWYYYEQELRKVRVPLCVQNKVTPENDKKFQVQIFVPLDVPSCNVECNDCKVDWHDERSLGNLFWLHTAQPMMISWGERTLRIAEFI